MLGNSTVVAASALIHTGPGRIGEVSLTAGSDAATLILYNNTAASGAVLLKLAVPAASTSITFPLPHPIVFGGGLYAALTGTAPSAAIVLV